MIFSCPHCEQRIEIEEERAGQTVDCPACQQSLEVPWPPSPAPASSELPSPQQRIPAPPPPPPVRRLPSSLPSTEHSSRKGSGWNFLLLLILGAAALFVFAMMHFNESPQQVWERFVQSIQKFTQSPPAPTPAPPPVVTVEATPTPAPSAILAPEQMATPASDDPVAWILAHKDHWPEEVSLLEQVEFPIFANDRPAGSAKMPAGTTVRVVLIEPGMLTVSYGGQNKRVPITFTDFRSRAAVEMARAAVEAEKEAQARAARLAVPTAAIPTASPEAISSEREDLVTTGTLVKTGEFIHPGLLHTDEDFRRMKTHRSREPWKSGWEKLIANRHASLDWKPSPQEVVYRGGGTPQNYARLFNDIAAAYACALRWRVSGDPAYAKKGVEICDAWSSTLKRLDGSADRFLAAGIYGYEFANAAEILRTYRGWKKPDFERFQKMMLEVFYPLSHDFLERHNGAGDLHYWSNWDACNIASVLAIGVLCDKHSIYQEAVRYFKFGKGTGAIRQAVYYIHPGHLGQMQESGRDQGHNTLSIALLGAVCEMAWNQGDDLYGYDNNRFLAGAEYVAKYNLGFDVPFRPYSNPSFSTLTISDAARGDMRPNWEMIYNHYANRKGLDAPYCKMFAEKARPEGGGGDYGPNSGGFDQLGYGTLTFTREPARP